jgi:hypothetical protein
MWNTIRPHLACLDPQRVESPCSPGIPDVEFIGGWMELKEIALPRRKVPILKVPKYTQEQRVWATRRTTHGGRVFFLLKVGHYWCLFTGLVAAEVVGRASLEDTLAAARKVWEHSINGKELLQCLRP